jgi:hypothetical protein
MSGRSLESTLKLLTESYLTQTARWPAAGRHILAQFDESTVVVYQAYRPEIGSYAAAHGRFGASFRLNRMSWIKPNFLWMMYRSGWGSKPDQQVTLAVRLHRSAFDEILRQAVHSSYVPALYRSPQEWKDALARSQVRLQWDPDHHPSGAPLVRRAIQLGLSGDILKHYASEWIVAIEDISEFVAVQSRHVAERAWGALRTPREDVYPVADPAAASRWMIDTGAAS